MSQPRKRHNNTASASSVSSKMGVETSAIPIPTTRAANEDLTRSQLARGPIMTTLSRVSQRFRFHIADDLSDTDDDNDLTSVDDVEERHMRMPQRRSFIETSREFMRPASNLV